MNIASPEIVDKRDDMWISSTCRPCYGTCWILADRVDGVVVKGEDNPETGIGNEVLAQEGSQ